MTKLFWFYTVNNFFNSVVHERRGWMCSKGLWFYSVHCVYRDILINHLRYDNQMAWFLTKELKPMCQISNVICKKNELPMVSQGYVLAPLLFLIYLRQTGGLVEMVACTVKILIGGWFSWHLFSLPMKSCSKRAPKLCPPTNLYTTPRFNLLYDILQFIQEN